MSGSISFTHMLRNKTISKVQQLQHVPTAHLSLLQFKRINLWNTVSPRKVR